MLKAIFSELIRVCTSSKHSFYFASPFMLNWAMAGDSLLFDIITRTGYYSNQNIQNFSCKLLLITNIQGTSLLLQKASFEEKPFTGKAFCQPTACCRGAVLLTPSDHVLVAMELFYSPPLFFNSCWHSVHKFRVCSVFALCLSHVNMIRF